MRLIDADALINRIVFHSNLSGDQKEVFEDEINALPSAQPEVIHCKDCKYYLVGSDGLKYCHKHDDDILWQDDDFCSKAERRTEWTNLQRQ